MLMCFGNYVEIYQLPKLFSNTQPGVNAISLKQKLTASSFFSEQTVRISGVERSSTFFGGCRIKGSGSLWKVGAVGHRDLFGVPG